MINIEIEAYAAHCGMANAIITIPILFCDVSAADTLTQVGLQIVPLSVWVGFQHPALLCVLRPGRAILLLHVLSYCTRKLHERI